MFQCECCGSVSAHEQNTDIAALHNPDKPFHLIASNLDRECLKGAGSGFAFTFTHQHPCHVTDFGGRFAFLWRFWHGRICAPVDDAMAWQDPSVTSGCQPLSGHGPCVHRIACIANDKEEDGCPIKMSGMTDFFRSSPQIVAGDLSV